MTEQTAAVAAASATGQGDPRVALRRVMMHFDDTEKMFHRAADLEDPRTRKFTARILRVELKEYGDGKKLRIVLDNDAREEATRKSEDGKEILEPEFFLGEPIADAIYEEVKGKEGHYATFVKDIKEHPTKPDRKISYLYWLEVHPKRHDGDVMPPVKAASEAPVETAAEAEKQPEEEDRAKPLEEIQKVLEETGISREDLKTRWEQENDPEDAKIIPSKHWQDACILAQLMADERAQAEEENGEEF